MRLYTLLYLFFLFSCSTTLLAQSANMNSLDSFSAKLITSVRENSKQQVYLVTDKSVYRSGEDIWFKAFLLNAVTQKLSNKNDFLFIDIVNDKDSVLNRIVLDAADKQLSSKIQLPDSLPTGYYWLRAYTKRMAETDTNNIGIKPLYVAGMLNNPPKLKKNINPNQKTIVNFYPEGGNLITGINSVMAVHISLEDGEPVSTRGYLKDNHDTVVTRFTTNAQGLGKFEFEPSGYRQYKVVLTENGTEVSYPLPPFDFYKGQLSVTKQAGNYNLRVLLGDSVFSNETSTYLIGIAKDSLFFASIGKGQYQLSIDEQKIPPGIATFYLFDKDFKLLSERSVYEKRSNLQINISTDKNLYTEHDKVKGGILITDADNHVIPALVAVSVSDSILSQKQQCNFKNDHLDFQKIDNFFLANNDCFTDDDMDLIMIARGSTYKNINTADQSSNEADSLFYIKGIVLNEKNSSAENKVVSIFSTAGSGFVAADTTDNKGSFCFNFASYPDSTKFIIDVKDINGVSAPNRVKLDSIIYPKLKTPATLKNYFIAEPGKIRQRFNTYYEWNNDGKQLPPVTVTDVVSTDDYDASKRVSRYSSILSGKDLDGSMPVDKAILKVSGFQILNGFLVMHGPNAFHADATSEPLVLVEGSQVILSSDGTGIGIASPVLNYLHEINPKDIDFIEVLKEADAAAYGVRGSNGVILINLLNKQRDDYSKNKNNLNEFYAHGVSKPEVFPEINHDKKNKKNTTAQDLRSTVFWDGDLFTADTENATLNFYTSDVPAVYNVTVTGITANGDIINKTITFKSN